MRKLLIIPFLLPFIFTSCEKVDLQVDVPACIERKIRSIQKEDPWNPPAQVWQWQVDGKVYYYFTSDCCDQFTSLYDSNCQLICAPDGGFTGEGDGKCPEFEGKIQYTLVWEDTRVN